MCWHWEAVCCVRPHPTAVLCTNRHVTAVQVFLVRKITGSDAGTLYAMKVLKKATLKGQCLPARSVAPRFVCMLSGALCSDEVKTSGGPRLDPAHITLLKPRPALWVWQLKRPQTPRRKVPEPIFT